MIATKIGFLLSECILTPKIKIFSIYILSFFTQNCKILIFYIISIGQIIDIYPSKRL